MESNKNELYNKTLDIAEKMKMYPTASSSNVQAIGYDKQSKLLKIVFKGGSTYIYFNVDESIWNKFFDKDISVGRTLNENIIRHKEVYKYLKLK